MVPVVLRQLVSLSDDVLGVVLVRDRVVGQLDELGGLGFAVASLQHDGVLTLRDIVRVILMVVDGKVLFVGHIVSVVLVVAHLGHDRLKVFGEIIGVVFVISELSEVRVAAVVPPDAMVASGPLGKSLLGVVALEVMVEEAIVVAIGGKLGVVKRFVVVPDALDILRSIHNIRVIRGVVVVGDASDRGAMDSLVLVVEEPPLIAAC